jgi:choline dehydrogenase
MASDSTNTYDFIVTGAGSAGCAVAGRLSEDGKFRVLLLEAGPKDSYPWIHVPLGYHKTFNNPRVNWMFESEAEPELNNRTMYQPRGKVLGGTSSINGMVYMRGNAADYDEWRQRGCEGWDYDSVLPYFKRAEDNVRGANDYHGVGGPLRVSDHRWQPRWRAPCTTRRSRPAFPPIPISTARTRKASATTRPRSTTRGAGPRRAPTSRTPRSAGTSIW